MPKGMLIKTFGFKEVLAACILTQKNSPSFMATDIERIVLEIGKAAQRAILTQGASIGSSWETLSQSTQMRKGHSLKYLDARVYFDHLIVIAPGGKINVGESMITAKKVRSGSGSRKYSYEWHISPDPSIMASAGLTSLGEPRTSTINLVTLAGYLEYGTKYIPARPLWGPLGTFAQTKIPRSLEKLYAGQRLPGVASQHIKYLDTIWSESGVRASSWARRRVEVKSSGGF
jgi:hypothetical protein